MRSMVIGMVGGCVWRYGYAIPKRQKYEEFYKNYDAEKVAKEMEAEMEPLDQEVWFLYCEVEKLAVINAFNLKGLCCRDFHVCLDT